MQIGDLTVEPISDGHVLVPPTVLFDTKTDEDWAPHRGFLEDGGQLRLDMGGFLVRSGDRTVVVDTGIGPGGPGAPTGTFMASLAGMGVGPGDVTDVVLTHLHFDHLGWCSDGNEPCFPEATYRCHAADWQFFLGPTPYRDELAPPGRTAADLLPAVAGRLETWSGDQTLMPGISARSAPGHTPGSTVIVLSSGQERAVLLGDAAHCPAELVEDDWEMISDIDRALARRTREALAQELEGTGTPAAAAHFPGLRFGRLLPGRAARRWVFE